MYIKMVLRRLFYLVLFSSVTNGFCPLDYVLFSTILVVLLGSLLRSCY